MAVQQTRKSRSRRDMRRSHDALTARAVTVDSETGETVCANAFLGVRKCVIARSAFCDEAILFEKDCFAPLRFARNDTHNL